MRSSAEAHMGRFVHMRASWLCIIFLGWINGYFRAIVLRPPLHHQQQHHISQMAANDLHQSQQHMIDWYTAEEVFSASPHTQTTNVASQGAITVDGYAPITTDNVYFLSNALSHTELGFLAADEHNVIHLRRQCETFVHFARGRPSKRQFHSIFFFFVLQLNFFSFWFFNITRVDKVCSLVFFFFCSVRVTCLR